MSGRRRFLLAAAALTVARRASGEAPFPSRPIRLLAGQAPGGQVDTLARALAQRIVERWKVAAVVENHAGASGAIAARAVAQAAPDGYTLLVGSSANLVIVPATQGTADYDPLRDFAPIGRIARVTYALVVRASLPATTVAEFVALARARPGAVSMATVGSASNVGMIATAFARAARIDLLQVPYKGGAPGVQALVAGDVDATICDLSLVAAHAVSGTLRVLAMVGAQRSALAADVPTLAEAGYRGVGDDPWYALVAPAQTPAAVIDALSSMLRDALRDDELRRRFRALGYVAFDDTPAAFARALADELAKARAAATSP